MPRMLPLFALLTGCALLIGGCASPARGVATSANSTLDRVLQSGTMRVCTPGDYQPFSMREPDGSYRGLDVDLAQSLAASLNAKPVWVTTTWKNLMPDMLAGKCDVAVGGISATTERQRTVWFGDPYLINGKVPLVRCADRQKYQSVADINRPDVRVIFNPGGTNERFARTRLSQAHAIPHPENLTIFDQVVQGKADVFVTESAEARVKQKQHPGVLCAVNPDKPLQFSENAFMLPRGDAVWQAYINRWLRLEKTSGAFDRTLKNWLD